MLMKKCPSFSLMPSAIVTFLVYSICSGTCNASRVEKVSQVRPQQRTLGEAASIFNVLEYGAKGDGSRDDTEAFEETWKKVCQVKGSTLLVPSGHRFLVKPISLSGSNCATNLVFQVDGDIIAYASFWTWWWSPFDWFSFSRLNDFTLRGQGTIDGQGTNWWKDKSPGSVISSPFKTFSGWIRSFWSTTFPTAVRISGSTGVTVTGIKIQNSPLFHLTIYNSKNVEISHISISSPGDSPNTDGIHLSHAQDVVIRHVDLACGDDCISMLTGTSNVDINDVRCGPGHGISIGSLGYGGSKACVTNITVRDVTMQNTMTGARIKTWQGGSGSVQGIKFSNIQVSNVRTPIMIDQYYCDKSKCHNMSSNVGISGVVYENIRGTYTRQSVHIACSDSQPCKEITLSNIQLVPAAARSQDPLCWQAFGEAKTLTVPSMQCLQMDKTSSDGVESTNYSC